MAEGVAPAGSVTLNFYNPSNVLLTDVTFEIADKLSDGYITEVVEGTGAPANNLRLDFNDNLGDPVSTFDIDILDILKNKIFDNVTIDNQGDVQVFNFFAKGTVIGTASLDLVQGIRNISFAYALVTDTDPVFKQLVLSFYTANDVFISSETIDLLPFFI